MPLRHAVLRTGRPLSTCCWVGDDLPSTFHFGLLEANSLDPVEILGIASLYRRAHKIAPGNQVWQLRGMAVQPERRNLGLGAILLEHVTRYCKRDLGGEMMWCNARQKAAGFYQRHGFTLASEEFEIEGIGPHFLMRRDL